jgi:hypothetical protein
MIAARRLPLVRMISALLTTLLALLLSGCVLSALLAGVAGKTVSTLDEAGFRGMGQRFGPALQSRNLLDDDGSWTARLLSFGFAPADAGDRLFRRLDPAFRFQKADAAQATATFAASRNENDELVVSARGFTLVQGLRQVNVSLIALADWDDDGKDDWFVRCAVRSVQPQADGYTRDYYLVITNPEAVIIHPQVIGVYDCHNRNCVAYADIRTCPPEDSTVDLLAGQRSVTAPPVKPGKTPKPDALQEHKLKN